MSESEKPVDCVCGKGDVCRMPSLTGLGCMNCGLQSGAGDTLEDGIAKWNKMQRVLKNGPAAEEALRIIARNLRAGAVSTQWVNKYANDTVEALDPA